jgi:hypothetical protein
MSLTGVAIGTLRGTGSLYAAQVVSTHKSVSQLKLNKQEILDLVAKAVTEG